MIGTGFRKQIPVDFHGFGGIDARLLEFAPQKIGLAQLERQVHADVLGPGLQEISLGFSFPKKWLDKTPLGSLSLTAQGFNLWYDAYNMPDGANFDPNVQGVGIGNGRGFDFINGPSSRRYGLSIKASF